MESLESPPSRADLRTLSRGGSASPSRAIPPPKFNYRTRVLLPGAILLALLLLIAYAARDTLLPAKAVTVVPVVMKDLPGGTATSVAPASAASGVQAPGWLEADPFPTAVTALSDGVVKEVLALEGQAVKAGDVVARLVDDDAKLNVARTQSDLAEKKATLEAAQRRWENPIELTRAVAVAEAMVNSSRAMLQKLAAEWRVESAKLALAKEEFERTQQATTQRALSEIELIRTRQQREAELKAAQDNLRLRIDDAKALAEAKAAVDNSQAMCDEAHLRLHRMEVKSPADGIVMQRHVTPGSKVMLASDDMNSAAVVHLYDPKKLQVRVDVPLADAAKVGVDQPAQIVVSVLPNQTFTGRVTRIVNEADIQKNTLQVKVAIDDPPPQLKPEMLARVKFVGASATATSQPTTSSGSRAIFARADLIRQHDGESMTYVADRGRSVAAHKSVRLGDARIDGWVQVIDGLNVGDALIVEQDNLNDGQRIRITGEAAEGASHGTH